MEESLIIFRFLFPTDENSPKAIHPGVEPLDDPTPGAAAVDALGGLFVAAGLDVRSVATTARFPTNNVRIESFIATKMLWAARSRTRAANRNTVESGTEEFLIVPIRTIDGQAQGDAAAVAQHRPLNAQLAPIGRVWPGFFPRPREPWWSSHRYFATSIGCRDVCRNVGGNISTACGTRRGVPTLGSSGARCCRNRTPAARPSTGSRCGVRSRCHP